MLKKKNKFKIDKSGFRKDLKDYFKHYMFQYKKQISPFIIIEGNSIKRGTHTSDLKGLKKDTVIFHTWPGKYKSDVFVYTIEEMLDWIVISGESEFYHDRLRGKV